MQMKIGGDKKNENLFFFIDLSNRTVVISPPSSNVFHGLCLQKYNAFSPLVSIPLKLLMYTCDLVLMTVASIS